MRKRLLVVLFVRGLVFAVLLVVLLVVLLIAALIIILILVLVLIIHGFLPSFQILRSKFFAPI